MSSSPPLFQDSAFGALVCLVATKKGARALPYPEEKPDFKLPEPWAAQLAGMNSEKSQPAAFDSIPTTSSDESSLPSSCSDDDEEKQQQAVPVVPTTRRRTTSATTDIILVDWYSHSDPANPQNWSRARRALVTALLCAYTWVVYMSSAIYVPAEPGVAAAFGLGNDKTEAALGLALFVLGYGTGPLLFSPLSELPAVGRNPVYLATMLAYALLSVPAALVGSYPGLLVLRFLQGFFGSPCLASGGASVGDMYSLRSLTYALTAWVAAAYCGPSLGPLLSGFSVPVMGWRWSLLEIIWAASLVFLAMVFFLPETSAPTILLPRAQRLRELTGDARFMSQSEIDQRDQTASAVLVDALIKPIEITIKDPAILFVQLYTAIIYGIYYSFFEVFPLVYPVYYGMSTGQVGLVFLCVLVACLLGVAIYVSYIYFYVNPRIRSQGWGAQEERLFPALLASFGPPIGLFIFAWTAAPQFPWIAPTVGIVVYGASGFVLMQSLFIYVPLSYPKYTASLFASNDFCRSALACGSILFASPMFDNLGVARGTSLLGGLSLIGIIGIFLLYIYGAKLRTLSKFAESSSEA